MARVGIGIIILASVVRRGAGGRKARAGGRRKGLFGFPKAIQIAKTIQFPNKQRNRAGRGLGSAGIRN
jgi:hypothetical protein